MSTLHQFDKETKKRRKRVGRGPGSGHGKTSCRGEKGDGSRSGYKRRHGKEGGQMPLYMKLPTRGFTRGKFLKKPFVISLKLIDQIFQDGDVVNLKELLDRKIISRREARGGLTVLSNGELTKKVTIEANKFSKEAVKKLEEKSVSFKTI